MYGYIYIYVIHKQISIYMCTYKYIYIETNYLDHTSQPTIQPASQPTSQPASQPTSQPAQPNQPNPTTTHPASQTTR